MAERDRPQAEPTEGPTAHPDEPGAYVGSLPERAADTIPGGIDPGAERIAAYQNEAGPVHDDSDAPPERREAGEDR